MFKNALAFAGEKIGITIIFYNMVIYFMKFISSIICNVRLKMKLSQNRGQTAVLIRMTKIHPLVQKYKD